MCVTRPLAVYQVQKLRYFIILVIGKGVPLLELAVKTWTFKNYQSQQVMEEALRNWPGQLITMSNN